MSDDPEALIRRRLEAGDVAGAVDEVYRSYARYLRAYLRQRLPSDDAAEEVVSDVFQALMRDLSGFRGESKLRTWLITVARHAMLRYFERERTRSDRTRPLDEVGDEKLAQSRPNIRSTHRNWLRRVMRNLSDHDRLLLTRWNEGWSWKELGEHLGNTEEGVRKRFTRLMKRLAEEAPE